MDTVMPSGPSRVGETFRVRECLFGSLWGKPCRTSLGDLRKYLIVEIVLLSVIMGVASGLVSMVFDETLKSATNFSSRGFLSYFPRTHSGLGR